MNTLKLILTTASTLKFLNYSFLIDEIILTVDFSLKKWDVILFQINSETSKNHSSRYESGLWTMFESKYDATKRECRELLKTLKKVRFWLYKVRFTIEIDVNILIAQLNCFTADLSEALMIRWLTWICLFDFNVRHIFDKRYTATDELFRKSCELSNDIDKVHEENIDDFINKQFNCVRVCSMRVNKNNDEQSLKNEYSEKFQRIIYYLITLTRSNHLDRREFRKFKNWTLQFFVRDRHLFKRVTKNILLWRVIDKAENQTIILKQFYDESEHREREKIYRRVTNRYWWRNLYRNYEKYIVNCESCQLRALNREKKTFHFIWISDLFQKINIDCVHLLQSRLIKTLIMIKNDLTEWIKICVLFNLKAESVAKFL